MIYGLVFRPFESIAGITTAVLGLLAWFWLKHKHHPQSIS
jgi:hypothetical protein